VMNRQDSRTRAEQAFRLRAMGRSWQEIADALGYRGRQSAQDADAKGRDAGSATGVTGRVRGLWDGQRSEAVSMGRGLRR
jgi:hypothetical protein